MGWGRRLAAVFLLLVSFGLGLWVVSALALVYLLLSFRPRGGGGKGNTESRRPHNFSLSKRHLLAGFFLLLAAAAAASGGVSSPFVFGIVGALILLWPRLGGTSLTRAVTPAPESVLLRGVLVPFSWFCLVEVKFGTGDPSRFLPALPGPLIMTGETSPHVYTLVGVKALDHSGAEKKVLESIRRQARQVAQRGAYLLPLDGAQASVLLRRSLEPLKFKEEDLLGRAGPVSDVTVLQHEGGIVTGVGAFADKKGEGGRAVIPRAGLRMSRRLLLWEVIESFGEERWPSPDECSGFLGSMAATRGEPLEERLQCEATEGGLVLQCAGGEKATLSRPQLRAVASIYS